jgi:hypothetical protein
MRIATIALLGSVFLLPAAPAAFAGSNTAALETATVTLSAQETKAKPKKAKKEKVEYMKSAAPPEPKK